MNSRRSFSIAVTLVHSLCVIANDLSQMQILASVDESDIGKIKQGQAASAEVSARYDVLFQQTLLSYYTGELDPRASR